MTVRKRGRRLREPNPHRFSTVRSADLIVVFDGATVVEVGPHAELLAAGCRYAELYDIRAAAYR